MSTPESALYKTVTFEAFARVCLDAAVVVNGSETSVPSPEEWRSEFENAEGHNEVLRPDMVLQLCRNLLLPIILLFCMVGAYAMTNSPFGIIIMLALGVVGWLMEENGFPIAPAILGLVLGEMLEQNFMTSMIKADGNPLSFFERPIAATLGIMTVLIWATMAWRAFTGRRATVAPSEADAAGA